jgi:hypothetical protein
MRLMKISIPKEAINQIIVNYNNSEKEAAKLYFDAVKQVVSVNTPF